MTTAHTTRQIEMEFPPVPRMVELIKAEARVHDELARLRTEIYLKHHAQGNELILAHDVPFVSKMLAEHMLDFSDTEIERVFDNLGQNVKRHVRAMRERGVTIEMIYAFDERQVVDALPKLQAENTKLSVALANINQVVVTEVLPVFATATLPEADALAKLIETLTRSIRMAAQVGITAHVPEGPVMRNRF